MKQLSMKNEIRNMNGIYQLIQKKSKLSFTENIVIFSLKKESLTETNPIIIKDCIEDKSKIENCIKINQSPAVQDKGSNLYNINDQYLIVNMKKKLINFLIYRVKSFEFISIL